MVSSSAVEVGIVRDTSILLQENCLKISSSKNISLGIILAKRHLITLVAQKQLTGAVDVESRNGSSSSF